MGFGNGAFQAARIAIDGVTIIQNILTGKIEAPGVTIPSTPSTTTTSSYLAIPITNTQNVATPAPFQQLVQLNLANYPKLSGVSGDLSNVYFSSDEAGQNKLYSWRETPSSLIETQTWWVLLPNGIPANGTITIYLQVSNSATLDGVYTGEAPQLSSTYGQYDNGAKVFTNYWNFAGTSLPSGWTSSATSSASVSVNNGITVSSNNLVNNASVVSNIQINSTTVVDEYITAQNTNNGQDMCLVSSSSSTSFSYQANSVGFQNGSLLEIENNPSGTPSVVASTNVNAPVAVSVINNTLYANYNQVAQISGQILANGYLALSANTGYNASFTVQWLRTRAYPPNGVMPALQAPTVKATQSIITSTENTWTAPQTYTAPQNINVGQTELTGTTAGSIVYSMPYQGTIYKKFIAYASGYENDTTTAQTISFPVAFTNTPYVITAPSSLISSISTTGITLASGTTTTYTGWIIIEGY